MVNWTSRILTNSDECEWFSDCLNIAGSSSIQKYKNNTGQQVTSWANTLIFPPSCDHAFSGRSSSPVILYVNDRVQSVWAFSDVACGLLQQKKWGGLCTEAYLHEPTCRVWLWVRCRLEVKPEWDCIWSNCCIVWSQISTYEYFRANPIGTYRRFKKVGSPKNTL